MPSPTAYNETELAAFVVAELSDVGKALSWSADTVQVTEAVNDVMLILGLDDLTEATSIRAVRATARVAGWRAAAKATAAQFTFSRENGVKYDRSDLQKMALQALSVAEAEAAELIEDDGGGINPGVKVGSMRTYDPYSPAVS